MLKCENLNLTLEVLGINLSDIQTERPFSSSIGRVDKYSKKVESPDFLSMLSCSLCEIKQKKQQMLEQQKSILIEKLMLDF